MHEKIRKEKKCPASSTDTKVCVTSQPSSTLKITTRNVSCHALLGTTPYQCYREIEITGTVRALSALTRGNV